MDEGRTYTAFAGTRRIASGDLKAMLLSTKAYLDQGGSEAVLIFEDWSGKQVDFDFRGTPEDVLLRVGADGTRSGPGRPRLGVISREVSLLPRHWEWLEEQPGGISVTLRRLVDEARKREPGRQRARQIRDAASRFMWSIAGDLPGFEEATRALFAGDRDRLAKLIRRWPRDVREHIHSMVEETSRLEGTSEPAGAECE